MGDIVIVGSGLAGHSAATELQRLDASRMVTLVGAEPGRPYDRPPLSKAYLLTNPPVEPLLGPGQVYDAGVTLRDRHAAIGINRRNRRLVLSDGASLPYDKLLLATGSRVRRLPGHLASAERVFYLRTLEDAVRLRAAMLRSRRVCIVGGGFIGLEIAAAARQLGCAVTVLEREDRLLSRAASPALATFLHHLHRRRGVELVLHARIDGVCDTGNGVAVDASAGRFHADMVVVGIGVIPNQELAEEAGLAVDDGILVDAGGRTSDPAVFAAGEVTRYEVSRLGRRLRTESWSSAASQAVVAARNLLGGDDRFDELPWFWSDQYDVSVQSLGAIGQASRVLRIGDPDAPRWLRLGLDPAGRLVGAEAVDMGREMSALRRAERKDQPVPPALLAAAREEIPEGGATELDLVDAADLPAGRGRP